MTTDPTYHEGAPRRDLSQLRIGDSEREHAAQLLSAHLTAGRLDLGGSTSGHGAVTARPAPINSRRCSPISLMTSLRSHGTSGARSSLLWGAPRRHWQCWRLPSQAPSGPALFMSHRSSWSRCSG